MKRSMSLRETRRRINALQHHDNVGYYFEWARWVAKACRSLIINHEYFPCVRESTAPPHTENCARSIVVTVEQQTPDDPSIDSRFDDAFWQEFVFGQKDQPFTLDHQVIQVLNTTSPNVYIYTGFGHQVIPDEHRDIIREAIPSAAEQLTGQRYSGRIESGTEHVVERLGWITVRYFTDADGHSSCGFTRVGTDPNTIFLNHNCMKRRGPDAIAYLKHVFVHEFGHAMGFKHVLAQDAVMVALGNLSDTFTAREQFHAQLAYKIGRGARYCGWPFSAECEQVNAIAGPNANTGTRSIAHAPLEHGDPLAQGAIGNRSVSDRSRARPGNAR